MKECPGMTHWVLQSQLKEPSGKSHRTIYHFKGTVEDAYAKGVKILQENPNYPYAYLLCVTERREPLFEYLKSYDGKTWGKNSEIIYNIFAEL